MATLKARLRDGSGKGVARKLRAAGEIPAIAYGHGQDSRSLSVNAHELELLLGRINPENTIIELNVDGAKPAMALIRDIQHHPSRPYIMHLDFFQVKAGEKLQVEVPVRLHGTPIGVRDSSGVLQEVLRELTVECLPKDIPSAIDINIEHLDIGQAVHVSDVTLPNAVVMNDGELVVCSVNVASEQNLPEPTAGEDADGEPERVGEKKEEE